MPHIVLVDDADRFREALSLNLIDEGYRVTSFANGRDALAYLAGGGAADAVLLNWRMPNLTGLEVLRRLRRSGITTPVIFLTVLSDDVYEEAALEGGAVDFIDRSRRADWSSPGDLFGSGALDDRLEAGACLIVVMALSVGLWAAIQWVVASLFSATV